MEELNEHVKLEWFVEKKVVYMRDDDILLCVGVLRYCA